eukprot:m.303405 g.303405  ORF g.303405 m.303405 type:complete len:356 (+) comp27299_c0_seq19:46-1113(+)
MIVRSLRSASAWGRRLGLFTIFLVLGWLLAVSILKQSDNISADRPSDRPLQPLGNSAPAATYIAQVAAQPQRLDHVSAKFESESNTHPLTHHPNIVYAALGGPSNFEGSLFLDLVYSLNHRVPNSTLKLFIHPDNQYSAKQSANRHHFVPIICNKLVQPYVLTRFLCYFDELKHELGTTKVGMVDATDVIFTGDVFDQMTPGVMYTVQEPISFPMAKCRHHKRWITTCVLPYGGTPTWNSIKHHGMLCAGTLFGSGVGLRQFMETFVTALIRTKCNDQGLLNMLVWTQKINTTIWTYEQNGVRSLNVVKNNVNLSGALVIHTGDGAAGRSSTNPIRKKYSIARSLSPVWQPQVGE